MSLKVNDGEWGAAQQEIRRLRAELDAVKAQLATLLLPRNMPLGEQVAELIRHHDAHGEARERAEDVIRQLVADITEAEKGLASPGVLKPLRRALAAAKEAGFS